MLVLNTPIWSWTQGWNIPLFALTLITNSSNLLETGCRGLGTAERTDRATYGKKCWLNSIGSKKRQWKRLWQHCTYHPENRCRTQFALKYTTCKQLAVKYASVGFDGLSGAMYKLDDITFHTYYAYTKRGESDQTYPSRLHNNNAKVGAGVRDYCPTSTYRTKHKH